MATALRRIKDDAQREALLEQFRTERANTNGWTNVLAGSRNCRWAARRSPDGYKPIIVLITDGKPETPEANSEFPEELAAFTADVQRFAAEEFLTPGYTAETCASSANGTPIYTVAMRNADAAADYSQEERELWQTISAATGGGYEEILPADEAEFQRELQTVFFELLRDWVCVQVSDTQFLSLDNGEAGAAVNVTTIQSNLFFSIVKSDPAMVVEVVDAAGNVVAIEDGGVSVIDSADSLRQTWSIERPEDRGDWAGQWTVRFTGNSDSEASFAQLTPYFVADDIRFNLIEPGASILPVGAELPIRAQVVDNAGVPFPPGAILNPRVTVTDADGLPVGGLGDPVVSQLGEIEAVVPALASLGSYDILLEAEIDLGGERLPVELRRNVDLATLPHLRVLQPSGGAYFPSGMPIDVDAQVMLGFERLLDESAMVAVSAELFNPFTGEVVETIALEPVVGDPNRFTVQVPPPSEPGEYGLRLGLVTQPLGGQAYNAPPLTTRFSVDPPPTPTPTFTPTPTPLPTATPTATPTPLPPPPTATPRPPLIERADIPPAAFALCGALILIPLLGLVGVLFFRNRPNLEGVYLEDVSHAGNDVLFGASYFGKTTKIYNHDGAEIAQLRFVPGADGVRVEVAALDDETEVQHGDYPIEIGEAFYPVHNDIIQVGNIRLRFDNETEQFEDDFDY